MGSLVRKTAVPGTRCGGRFSSIATRSASGNSSLRDFSNNSLLPRRHVYINSMTIGAERQRNPAALHHLEKICGKERQIEKQKRCNQRGGGIGDHFHTRHTTTNPIMPVTTMVPVTEMP